MQGWNAQTGSVAPFTSFLRTTVTVGTTPTALPTTALANRKVIWVYNPSSSVTVNLGPSTMTSVSTEFILASLALAVIPFSDALTLYGVVASSTLVVVVWELV